MQQMEIQVRDLFKRESFLELNREEQWAKALADGWVFSVMSGCFRMKVIKCD